MLLVHAKANRNLQEIKTKLKPNFSDYWVNQKELSIRRNCKKVTITIRIENYTIAIYYHARRQESQKHKKMYTIK